MSVTKFQREIWSKSIQDDLEFVTQEMKLGLSGTSGWQKGKNCLEFQVIDTKSKNVINPFILMPVLSNKVDLSIKNLIAINKGCSVDEAIEKIWNLQTLYQKTTSGNDL